MKNLFDKVKSSITIDNLMMNSGIEGKEYGGGKRYNYCPACNSKANFCFSVKATGIGHCFNCGFTGSVIDLYSAMVGKDTMTAAKELADNFDLNKIENIIKPQKPVHDILKIEADKRKTALQTALKKLYVALAKRLEVKPNPSAKKYLVETRFIDASVVSLAEYRKLVAYLPANPKEAQALLDEAIGRELLVESGLMKLEGKMAAIAFRPLVFFMPGFTGAEFRLIREQRNDEPKSIRYGELKYPYWWQGTSNKVTIVEGAIDLLSMASLGNTGTLIALPGCQSWQQDWPARIQHKYGTQKFVLALDTDDAGEQAALKIAEGLHKDEFQCTRLRPSAGCKDWNDELKAKRTQSILNA